MIEIIREISDRKGTAVLYAGHHEGERFLWAHTRFRMAGGSLVR
jgi:hypothetical protein